MDSHPQHAHAFAPRAKRAIKPIQTTTRTSRSGQERPLISKLACEDHGNMRFSKPFQLIEQRLLEEIKLEGYATAQYHALRRHEGRGVRNRPAEIAPLELNCAQRGDVSCACRLRYLLTAEVIHIGQRSPKFSICLRHARSAPIHLEGAALVPRQGEPPIRF